jgi:hypothetical protein
VLNQCQAKAFRFRTLNIMPTSALREDVESGRFQLLTPIEILEEQRQIIAQIDPHLTSAMYNDHISNYLGNLESDNIGRDKAQILQVIDNFLSDPATKLWKHKALKSM